jgi:hypothetical protein
MKKTVIILLLILFNSTAKCQITVHYSNFNVDIYLTKYTDTIKVKTNIVDCKNCLLKLYIEDFCGKAKFELFNKNGIIIQTGSFDSARDTLTKYNYGVVYGLDEDVVFRRVNKIKYLNPLQSGLWIDYSLNKRVIRKTKYVNEFR